MHTPKYNQETDPQVIASFIRANAFGMIINTDESGVPQATHIPMELLENNGEWTLQGHINKANPQWQWFTRNRALAVFAGPHAYISSSWYEKDKIPTWNYMTVHLHGDMRILTTTELEKSLERLMDTYEAGSASPVRLHDISQQELAAQLKGIVGFEMRITDINARFKLSQNKQQADYQSVISHLRAQEDPLAQQVAAEMEKRGKE